VKTEIVTITYANGQTLKVRRPLLEIFQPSSTTEVDRGTSSGGAAICPVTGYTTSVQSVRQQLAGRGGGAADARLICVIGTNPNSAGRLYLSPKAGDTDAARQAACELQDRIRKHLGKVSLIPDRKLNHLRGFFNVVLYGMTTWGDLF